MGYNKLKLNFFDGKVFFNNLQVYILPVPFFLYLINKIQIIEGIEKTESILKLVSEKDSFLFFNNVAFLKVTFKEKLERYLEFINYLGYGEIQIRTISKNKFIFLIKKPVLSKFYKLVFEKESPILLENILIGYLEYFFKFYFKKDVITLVKMFGESIILEIEISNNDLNLTNEGIKYGEFKQNGISHILRNVLINNHIKNEHGTFKLWKTYATIIPFFYLIELFSILDYDKYSDFIKDFGIVQGKIATDIQKDYFGIKDNNKLFKQIIDQSEISGLGKIHICVHDNKNLIFSTTNNIENFSLFFSIHKIKLLQEYFLYIYKGSYEYSFDISSKIILTSTEKNKIHFLNENNDQYLTDEQLKIYNLLKKKLFI